MLPMVGARARVIATDSAFSRTELVRRAGFDDRCIRIVPCGCDHILDVEPDDRVLERTGLVGRPFVLAVGGYRPHKNLALVDRALRLLGEDAPVLAVLGVPDARVFGRGARMHGCLALGRVTDGELRSLYQHAACLAFPSRYEGFGLPPLEAMACGCPVVVARAGALPEVCGVAARYVDPDDEAELARTLLDLLCNDDERRALVAAGHERSSAFTWRRAAEATIDIVRELLADGALHER
jgi:glycosyltransferase involved in cell wall biosynthesis